MAMIVQHNMTAMNSNRMLGITTNQQAKQAEKLASGYRINRAGDDAAGLSISEKMRYQIKGLQKASKNAQDGISAIQTAEGALNETHAILQRMNELATQAANDTNTSTDRTAINDEITQLLEEVDRIQSTTQFNTKNLLDGNFSADLQVGALEGHKINVKVSTAMSKTGLSIDAISVASHDDAASAMTSLQNAIETVSTERSKLGAIQNRLEHTINNLDNVAENTQAAESRIRDTDMASEMVEYSKNNILAQAGQAMLAQGNQSNQGVLSLLQ